MDLKSTQQINLHSMTEDDHNQNQLQPSKTEKARWGPSHAGAIELASQYTFGKLNSSSLDFTHNACIARRQEPARRARFYFIFFDISIYGGIPVSKPR